MEDSLYLLLAAMLLNRFEPMAPHHVGAIRELLGDNTDDELREIVHTGRTGKRDCIECCVVVTKGEYGDIDLVKKTVKDNREDDPVWREV